MAQREYEFTVLIRATIPADQLKKTTERIQKTITDGKGTILHCIDLGKRSMAYEIEKEAKATYLYCNFISDGDVIKALEPLCRHDEDILRFLTVQVSDAPDVKVRKTEKNEDLKYLGQCFGVTLMKEDPASPAAAESTTAEAPTA